jgi:argininosuccinate lyase
MKTLWDKGFDLDSLIAKFTIGDDQEIDKSFVKQEIRASIAHVKTLNKANLITETQTFELLSTLIGLYSKSDLKPTDQDEDIHSTIERILIENLGSVGKRVHTARSRNDQIATDISLWVRDKSLELKEIALSLVEILLTVAEENQDNILLGMTHLQPAMPSSIGAWLLGYATLFLEDALLFKNVYDSAQSCPLGSAAGYGVPHDLAPLDREYTAKILGFERSLEPVTSVQGGRGKLEANILFACSQTATTSARFARDLVLYVTPQFNFVELPIEFTTGSSIMPQKRNPDVLELIRGSSPLIHSTLSEVLTLSSFLPSGYHRDFQKLKAPLLRGVGATQDCLSMLRYMTPHLKFNHDSIEKSCTNEIDATRRALQLVVEGMPFRDAYKQVAQEVFKDQLPLVHGQRVPKIDQALNQVKSRLDESNTWLSEQIKHNKDCLESLFKD